MSYLQQKQASVMLAGNSPAVDESKPIHEVTDDYVRMCAELTEARKEIESLTEHAAAMENSSNFYRENLDEARRLLDVARKALEIIASWDYGCYTHTDGHDSDCNFGILT